MTLLELAGLLGALGGIAAAGVRWLRVAQREHYLPGATARFAARWWWRSTQTNRLLGALALGAVIASLFAPVAAVVTGAVLVGGPIGLGIRGRTSGLNWTRRLSLVAAVTVGLEAALLTSGALTGGLRGVVVAAAAGGMASPAVIDLALALLRPVEDLLAGRYVRQAAAVLGRVHPIAVGVTGSFGKTSTKGYIAHLVAARHTVVASPRSFNNRAGLARTVNEHLTPGTEVLVAEMGAYGPGEIAAMCRWLRPEISVITAIGPAHLERFRTLERTTAAKAEITRSARVVVLNVDDPHLEGLANELAAQRRVVRTSARDPQADVAVLPDGSGFELRVAGHRIGVVSIGAGSAMPVASNIACAVAVALELGVTAAEVIQLLPTLPGIPNRLQRYQAVAGYLVLDDTFNSNPAGARLALEALAGEAPGGRRVLVTPGIVELGSSQYRENAALAEGAGAIATDIVVVGGSNRRALLEGCSRSTPVPRVEVVAKREDAVLWARANLGPGDAVLFENDLPDHFP